MKATLIFAATLSVAATVSMLLGAAFGAVGLILAIPISFGIGTLGASIMEEVA